MLKGAYELSQDFLLRQLPHPTVVLNTRLELMTASDSWYAFFGIIRQNTTGRSILDIFPEASQKWREALQSCLSSKSETRGIKHYLREGQDDSWFEWINSPFYDSDENLAGIISQVIDVTRHVRHEIEEERLRLLLEAQSENARIGSWTFDAHSETLFWSDMTRQIHEVPDDFVPTLDNAIRFYKDGYSRNAISMAVFRAMETGSPWKEQLQVVTHTGREIRVIAAGKPLYKNGEYVGLFGTFQDITEIHQSHQQVRENAILLRTIVDNLPLNLYIKDLESRKTLVNKSECAYLGVSDPAELLGKSDFDLYPENMARISREEDLYVMDNKKPILSKETMLTKMDGTDTYFLSSKIPLYNEEQEVYGLMGISMDITELKNKESELRNLIDVTSQQNKKLINFAHIVSHNLRSHSANFSMLLEFLNQENGEAEKQQILGMLTQASDNLLDTLDNLNEVVAINTQVELEKSPVRLRKAAEEVVRKYKASLAKNRALVHIDISDDMLVQAVPAYLDNIVENLLSNALKYKHPDREPEIRITAEKVRGFTVLTVADNGLGIDLKKNGSKLFGMYKTFHEHPDARGIGLFICKNQIEAMGGSIKAGSQVGEGSQFKVYFNDRN